MFGSNTIEIAIGVIFAFLSVSLICTAINELIAARFRGRARELERGIRNLLDGTSAYPPTPLQRLRRADNARPATAPKPDSWGTRFFQHPLINGMAQDNQVPSYVPSSTFASALLDLVAETAGTGQTIGEDPGTIIRPLIGTSSFNQIRAMLERIPDPYTSRLLLALLEEARGDSTPNLTDLQKFRGRVQVWYDQAMDRVGGWYRRRTSFMLLVVAIAICTVANIDTVAVFHALAADPALRATAVAAAGKAVAPTTMPAVPEANDAGGQLEVVKNNIGRLNALGIPIGWVPFDQAHPKQPAVPDAALAEKTAALDTARKQAEAYRIALLAAPELERPMIDSFAHGAEEMVKTLEAQISPARPYVPRSDNFYDFIVKVGWSEFWTKVLGILLTAFAASLGAPFWFDLLNRVMSVRATGKAPEERPKDPKKVLQPESP